jgi:ATPase subunit of ABC transporter with duplicated ATPase domains
LNLIQEIPEQSSRIDSQQEFQSEIENSCSKVFNKVKENILLPKSKARPRKKNGDFCYLEGSSTYNLHPKTMHVGAEEKSKISKIYNIEYKTSNKQKTNQNTINSTDLWINKYCPLTTAQIIGNKDKIALFKNWLHNLTINKNQTIIISGNQGIGKTLIIKLLLLEEGYNVRIINPNEIKDHRIYDDFNDYHNFTNSIYSKISFANNNSNKIALIFDETENITLTSEKKYIMDIYK